MKENILGVDLKVKKPREEPIKAPTNKGADEPAPVAKPEEDPKPYGADDCMIIEGLPEIIDTVEFLIEEKRLNPNAIQEGDAGLVHIEGKPMIIIDNKYVPEKEAVVILQTRKVVAEYLKLQKLIAKK